jgi:hypothetical protein
MVRKTTLIVAILSLALFVPAGAPAKSETAGASAIGVEQARVVTPAAQKSMVVYEVKAPLHMATEVAAAQAYWGNSHPPLCSALAVIFEGTPSWNPSSAGEATRPTSPNTLCLMAVIPTDDAALRCRIIVHEYGHWLGLDHEPTDRLSPMYIDGPYWAPLPECDVFPGFRAYS